MDAFRGMNAFALLLAHKSMAMAHSPYTNKTSFSEVRTTTLYFTLTMRQSLNRYYYSSELFFLIYKLYEYIKLNK